MCAPTKQMQIDALVKQVEALTAERNDLLIERALITRTMDAQQHTITHLTQERDTLRAELDAVRDTRSGMDTPAVDQGPPPAEEAEPVVEAAEGDDAMESWQQHNNCAFGRHAAFPTDADIRRPYCMHCGVRFTAHPRRWLRMAKGLAAFVVMGIVGWLLVAQFVPVVQSWFMAGTITPPSGTLDAGASSVPTALEDTTPRPAVPPNPPSILVQW